MYTPFWIARRYVAVGKKKHIVYRMGFIACLSVALSTMALLVVLSVFNGLEGLIRQLFYTFDPELKVQLQQGSYFNVSPTLLKQVATTPGVSKVVEVWEENALLACHDRQLVVKLKGVSENFLENSPLAPYIVKGALQLSREGQPCALIGIGIQHALSIRTNHPFHSLQVFLPSHTSRYAAPLQKLYHTASIRPGAIFSIEKKFDDSYVIVPLSFMTKLLQNPDRRTALEIQLKKDIPVKLAQKNLQKLLPAPFVVLNRDQQQMTLLRTLQVEKLLVFATFSLIVLVASLNIFFILSMLVLAKSADIATLHVLGMEPRSIKHIFMWEGLLIGLLGALAGMLLAWLLTWLQEKLGLISLGLQTSLVKAYPVRRQLGDFIYVGLGVFLATLLASYKPALLTQKMMHVPKGYF